jgi:hypothetical protein
MMIQGLQADVHVRETRGGDVETCLGFRPSTASVLPVSAAKSANALKTPHHGSAH